MRFEDQVVVVTGAGGGVGRVLVRRFASEGAQVISVDLRVSDGAGAERVTEVGLDVTDGDAVRAMVAGVVRDHGRLDVLVNAAMIVSDTEFSELSEAQWDAEVDVALKGAFLCTQAALPPMIAGGGGAIVNVSSVNAVGYFGNEAYSAAKAGMLSLTRSIAVKYGPSGVRCNALLPGTIRTPAWEERLARTPDILERMRVWYPLGRVGEPDDVASAVLFLASRDASWITGAVLPVDGGLLAGNAPMMRMMTSDEEGS